MQNQYRLAERAVLMRLSAGLPGKNRTDKALTADVKAEKSLDTHSGRWVKERFPQWALEPLEKLVNEARAYHARVTLPFDNGIGILPAAIVQAGRVNLSVSLLTLGLHWKRCNGSSDGSQSVRT